MMRREAVYSFAELTVHVSHQYEYLSEMCRDYISTRTPDVSITLTDEDVARERERSEDGCTNAPYLESLAFYRKLCEWAVFHRVLLFHCSAIAVDGVAYLFAAPSGTGKSTHTALWRRVFGERAVMINDDKPLLLLEQDGARVFGTPWDGKHRLSNNISAPIGGICFLARGEQNEIERVSPNEALPRLLGQTFRPEGAEGTARMLQLAIELTARVPMWSLRCNISEQAVHTAYGAMNVMRKDEKE